MHVCTNLTSLAVHLCINILEKRIDCKQQLNGRESNGATMKAPVSGKNRATKARMNSEI